MSASKPDEWLKRKDAARYLGSLGYTISPGRLGNLGLHNNRDGGPPFTRFNQKSVRYNVQDLRAWLEARSKRYP